MPITTLDSDLSDGELKFFVRLSILHFCLAIELIRETPQDEVLLNYLLEEAENLGIPKNTGLQEKIDVKGHLGPKYYKLSEVFKAEFDELGILDKLRRK